MKTQKEIQHLLDEGYRCILRGYRVNLCSGERCHHKDICIFMNGGPGNYTETRMIRETLL